MRENEIAISHTQHYIQVDSLNESVEGVSLASRRFDQFTSTIFVKNR